MPAFGHNPTPGTRPDQDRLQPFGEEIPQFFPEVDIELHTTYLVIPLIFLILRRPKDLDQ